ncbi:putative restriction endonuclease [Hoeflea halophila]|uniref:Putative restriction endonuclease n=1 Tax=Hoeflea halophila TaxID=714899 RepID=A0A286HRR8_9HYPH|nr:HNH endonuclease [Hoeflea halophila]SOE10523.1 putative restriction endonuclease [Hoeflea halophila]
MKAVFYHKPDSRYDDVTGQRYHFPHIYLSRVQRVVDDWMVYYGPLPHRYGRYYSGIARVAQVRADPSTEKHFYADLVDFIDFDRPVEYKENSGYEKRLVQPDGTINNGYKVQAVRELIEQEFASIVQAGLSEVDEWPDRIDPREDEDTKDSQLLRDGFEDQPQAALLGEAYERPIVEQLLKRKWRDSKFKQHIRIAYDRTCAFTGLRLINGKGRPEVEAAHIRPVDKGGNDWVRNGIALSGTVHWMFDRGLLSMDDDFTILRSRHLNSDVGHLLNKDLKAKVPTDLRLQPHPEYMGWHRRNVFKA